MTISTGSRGAKAADAAQRLDAANAGHVDVEQNNIDGSGMEQLQGFFAARGLLAT